MSALSPIGAYNIEASDDGGNTWYVTRCYLGSWADTNLAATIDRGESVWVYESRRFRYLQETVTP